MREKLIELIKSKSCDSIAYTECMQKTNADCEEICRRIPIELEDCEKLADHLLANGVVVIRCNIGDTVYQADGVRIYELTILDVSLHKNKPYYETDEIDFDDDAIGKSIFLIREEAEAKLQEGEG